MPRAATAKKPAAPKTTAAKIPTTATLPPVDEMLQALVDEVGREKAIEFYERLPEAIAHHIQRIAESPTPEEVGRINASFTKWYPVIRPALNAAIARVNESRLVLIQGGADDEES